MSQQQIVATLQNAKDDLSRRYAISQLALFGSASQDEASESSDIDLLVSFTTTPDLLTFLELEEELTRLLGKKVDLVPERKLKATLRESIDREKIAV
jgi:predicted nucleotidyltransferase